MRQNALCCVKVLLKSGVIKKKLFHLKFCIKLYKFMSALAINNWIEIISFLICYIVRFLVLSVAFWCN